jgi:hypothetical protein
MAGHNIASEQQFQEWERLTNEEGVKPYEASRLAETTLSALKRGDRVRYEQGMAVSAERQAAKIERMMDGEIGKDLPSPQLVALEAKAYHPEVYGDKTRLEISGTVEHEHRGVFAIGDLARTMAELGVLEQLPDARPQAALSAAGEVSAGRAGDAVDPPGDLPAARRS